jgi:hypothetical protein
MIIRYKTSKEIKNYSYQNSSSESESTLLPYSADKRTYYGFGVSIAQAIGVIAATSAASSVTSTSFDVDTYCHVLAFEIYNNDKILQSKTDITWNSRQLDILDGITVSMQTAFSALPSDMMIVPNVPKIKDGRANDYFNTSIKSRSFNSPALPYKTRFRAVFDGNYNYTLAGIDDKYAIMAYIDLLQTSEFALPLNDKKWNTPMDPNIWKNVMLGGKYLLGDKKEPINILIKLQSDQSGYNVINCKVVSNAEYEQFLTLMNKWKKTLYDYFDFYE